MPINTMPMLTAIDPFGNKVLMPDQLFEAPFEAIKPVDILDRMEPIVEQPALIIEDQEGANHLHYLRAIGWETTVLLSVQPAADHLEATKCIFNPTHTYIGALIKKGCILDCEAN